jgi:hypothetical protein
MVRARVCTVNKGGGRGGGEGGGGGGGGGQVRMEAKMGDGGVAR